jgi:Prion-inhibition and propagation
MEPVSFAVGIVGLAGLFSVCLDVVDKVDSYKDFSVDSHAIVAQFDADKHRFKKWCQAVGYEKTKLRDNHHGDLDNPEISSIVLKILLSIEQIFTSTEDTASHLQSVTDGVSISSKNSLFHRGHSKPQMTETISKRRRIGWSLRSKARFTAQVHQFGGLVQRLCSLIPPDGPAGQLNTRSTKAGIGLNSLDGMYIQNSHRIALNRFR